MTVSYECEGNERIRKLMQKITSFNQFEKIVTKNYVVTGSKNRYYWDERTWSDYGYIFTINTNDWSYYCKDWKGHLEALIKDLEWYLITRNCKTDSFTSP